MEPAFSRAGESPTTFELHLVTSAQLGLPTQPKEQWIALAQRIGLASVMAVLDEFGDASVWVPSRSGLLQPLWAELREREVARLRAEGESISEIARKLGVHRRTVNRAPLHGGAHPRREISAK